MEYNIIMYLIEYIYVYDNIIWDKIKSIYIIL